MAEVKSSPLIKPLFPNEAPLSVPALTLNLPVSNVSQANAVKSTHALVTPVVTPRDATVSPPTLQDTAGALPIATTKVEAPTATRHAKISPPASPKSKRNTSGTRLNKFVRRLHDMLQAEQGSGIVEWRRGLLVLHSTDAFAKTILPRYFNTRNFKTFRRQLNYYGFVHVRSFSTTGSTTTALWVNRDLANRGTANVSSVLMLKRVEPCDSAKTAEGRRVRKELAVSTVEDDIGVSTKSLQLQQIRSMALRSSSMDETYTESSSSSDAVPPSIPLIVHCHGVNSTMTSTVQGSTSKPNSFLPLEVNNWSHNNHSNNSDASIDYSSGGEEDDAANLLLMLSKSSVTCT